MREGIRERSGRRGLYCASPRPARIAAATILKLPDTLGATQPVFDRTGACTPSSLAVETATGSG